MRQEFELTLCNYARYAWLGWAGSMTALGLTALFGMKIMPHTWGAAGVLPVLLLCLYGVYQLLRKVSLRPALLVVHLVAC
jgi:hypothetical protein